MARHKQIDMSPRLLAVDLSRQILHGSFEFALSHLIDRLNLSERASLRLLVRAHAQGEHIGWYSPVKQPNERTRKKQR